MSPVERLRSMASALLDSTCRALADFGLERTRQDVIWGEQHHPDGTEVDPYSRERADIARELCRQAARLGSLTWKHILREEVYEAFAETDPVRLRAELVQVGAVAAAWIEDIDSREGGK